MHMISPAALSDARIIAGYAIFIASYVVFAFGKFPWMKIDRPGAAIIGAVLMVAFRIIGPAEALRAVDFTTIVLLFAMMLVVAYLHLAGFFDRFADLVVNRLGARHLLPAVILSSGVLSAFFVNDIICLVMVPLVLTITRRLRVPPLGYLLAVATASNIGSVASITGNPQNMLVGSYSHISYRNFLAHLGPVAALGLLVDWAILNWLFPHREVIGASEETAIEPLAHDPLKRIAIGKPLLIVGGLLIGFLVGVPPALVAAVAAAVVLISRTREPRLIYDEVDWGLLIFFAGLFLIVDGAERVGLVAGLFDLMRDFNLHNAVVFTPITAALSNIVSNVPAVMLLKTVIPGFPDPHRGWLLLAMASTLAGNLTITGSVANIIVVERARGEVDISFRDYLRAGVPVTVVTLMVGTSWLWLVD